MFLEALIRLMVAEHKQKPITGNVLTLGKQSVPVPYNKIKQIFKENDCPINPNFEIKNAKMDTTTRGRGENTLDDESFFQLFGDINYETMDVSEYENASIIHNLNDPIPKELEEKYDFIIDGGTFDHLFDLKACFQNITKLLKPGGRIFQWNAASNFSNAGYLSFSADFFNDYFTLNKFADCRTYFARSWSMGGQNWCLYQFKPPMQKEHYRDFNPSYFYTMVLVFAEKGPETTYDKIPIQLQYRDKELRDEYIKNSEQFRSHKTQPDIKTIPLRAVKMPNRYKILHMLEPKPYMKDYRKIGWV